MGRHDHARMVVGFITTYAIHVYHHQLHESLLMTRYNMYGASSLKQQSACTLVTPLEHIILIPNSLLLFLLNAVC
jgi:hypothetical protein